MNRLPRHDRPNTSGASACIVSKANIFSYRHPKVVSGYLTNFQGNGDRANLL